MSDSIEDVIAALQKEYVASFPQKRAEIEGAWSAADLKSLKTFYHRLKGSGSTYRMPDVTRLGTEMESACARGDVAALAKAVPLSLEMMDALASGRELRDEAWTLLRKALQTAGS